MKPVELPRWADLVVLPAFNLLLALGVCGVVIALMGQDPWQALGFLLKGALGSPTGLSYTLYYATTFTFTGLAVAVALHAGLFNIGAEGQALLGGLGVGLTALWLGDALPAALLLPLMVIVGMGFGAAWGAIPGALQAWRGSHIVITTIMANFIASSLLAYLMVHTLKDPGSQTAESRPFAAAAQMPPVHTVLQWLGLEWPATPLNLSVVLALGAALFVHILVYRSRIGYRWRASGHAPAAAQYAGIEPRRQILAAMATSGALAAMVGVNEIAGVHGRLLLDFVFGAGFTGIAVSLIGRNHPVGIMAAALLFGALYQGGAELSFEMPGISRDMVVTLQGLIVLFAGALARMAAPWLEALLRGLSKGGRHG